VSRLRPFACRDHRLRISFVIAQANQAFGKLDPSLQQRQADTFVVGQRPDRGVRVTRSKSRSTRFAITTYRSFAVRGSAPPHAFVTPTSAHDGRFGQVRFLPRFVGLARFGVFLEDAGLDEVQDLEGLTDVEL
jgi:hypothetical protein